MSEIRLEKQNMSIAKQVEELQYLKNAIDEAAIVTKTDKNGRITFVNDQFCKITKYDKKDLIGKNHNIMKSGYHSEKFYRKLWRVIKAGKVWTGEIKNRGKDGKYHWFKTTIIPRFNSDGKATEFTSIRVDITEQKETEEKLRQALAELKELDNMKDEFGAMISHELKTPLTPILGYCEMLLDDELFSKLPSDHAESIDEIRKNALRLERLISDILDAQKLEMNKMNFKNDKINLADLMEAIKKTNLWKVKEKEIELSTSVNDQINFVSDEDRLIQVITNLVNNSIDFVQEEKGLIEISSWKDGSELVFCVKDNGCGIPEEKYSKIFKKFYQVDTGSRRSHGGTGLGLIISKKIVESLGGTMWFESQVGKGTSFYFTLPHKVSPNSTKADNSVIA